MYNSNSENSQIEDGNKAQTRKSSIVAGDEVVLNENSKDIDEKTKKLLNKKIVIGIICILAIIMCVVIYSVLLSKNNNEQENELNSEAQLLVKDNETYEGLNYTTNVNEIAKLGFYYNYSKNEEGVKIEATYISVDGLKDEELEAKINDTLKNEAQSMYDEKNIQDNTVLYDHIYNYTDVYIFNNVLSTLYCEEKCDTDGNVTYEYKSVNINLKDYETIELSDVFTSVTDVKEIVETNTKASFDNELVFSLSPKFVYVVDNDKKVEKISLYKNKDKVAIYKRFSEGKKMFDKTFSASPYVFTTKKFIESDVYGLEESNLFIDTCDLIDEEEFPEKVVETARSLYKDALNKARNLSYSNPSKRYLVQIVPNIVKQSDENYNVYVKINSYEIAKQFFNEHISEFIIASENKSDKEIEVVDYFTNPAMNAKEYLNKSNTDTLTKVVDNNGTEIINKNNSGAGIS